MKKLVVFFLFVFLQTTYSKWESCNNGIQWPWFLVDDIVINGDKIFVGISDQNLNGFEREFYMSTDNGSNWVKKNVWEGNFLGYKLNCLAITNNIIFAGTQSGIYTSSDNGDTWSPKTKGMGKIYSFAISGNNIYAGIAGFVLLSTDNGGTWVGKNNGFRPGEIHITSIAINGNNIFAAYIADKYYDGYYISTDNGNNWSLKSFEHGGEKSNSFASSGNIIYTGLVLRGINLSTDNGNSWKRNDRWISNDSLISYYQVRSFLITGNYVFAGTEGGGLYISTINGSFWISMNTGLYNKYIKSLATNGNYVFVGTNDGIYRSKISDITSIDEQERENDSILIYPNPVENNLTVFINSNQKENKIEILNLLGEKLQEIIFREKTTTINIEFLATGVYFLKIGSEVKIFVKK